MAPAAVLLSVSATATTGVRRALPMTNSTIDSDVGITIRSTATGDHPARHSSRVASSRHAVARCHGFTIWAVGITKPNSAVSPSSCFTTPAGKSTMSNATSPSERRTASAGTSSDAVKSSSPDPARITAGPIRCSSFATSDRAAAVATSDSRACTVPTLTRKLRTP